MSVLGSAIGMKSASSIDNLKNDSDDSRENILQFKRQIESSNNSKIESANHLLQISDNVIRTIHYQQRQAETIANTRLKEQNSLQSQFNNVRNSVMDNNTIPSYGGGDYKSLLAKYYDGVQFQCAIKVIQKESGGRITAENKSSKAYGLFQALPAVKMASYGNDWRYNVNTQVKWGVSYINHRYHTPCNAWAHEVKHNWY